jgi:hypothetical protein
MYKLQVSVACCAAVEGVIWLPSILAFGQGVVWVPLLLVRELMPSLWSVIFAVTLENHAGQTVPGEPEKFSGDAEVHSITDAGAAHSAEMRQRMIKYALAMGIRMVCLVMIFVVDGWFKIIAVAGAVFLPWIAVVIANGDDKAEAHSDLLLDSAPLAEIESPPAPFDDGEPGSEVLQGELITDDDDEETSGQERRAS